MYFEVISKEYKEFVTKIRDYFADTNAEVMFERRNVIKIVDFDNMKFVVKSFKIPHFINKIAYTFLRDSKAKKSYRNSLILENFAPRAIAFVEFKKFGLLYDSYFISEEFKCDFTIREPLLDSNFNNRENLLRAFARFTYKLHEKGVFHKDYSPGNILIKENDSGYEFKIVDVNRMVFKQLTLDECLDNFSQLWAKDEDLKVIMDEYSKVSGIETDIAIMKALKYSQALKNRKNFKKRLKGKKVVD